jgi:hypothetical protein
MTNTTQDYWKSVKSIATEAQEEYPRHCERLICHTSDDARDEYIRETVDGSEWIIYFANNETVLTATNNHDAIDDVGLEATTDWKQTRMICAFYAMLQDVNDEMGEK